MAFDAVDWALIYAWTLLIGGLVLGLRSTAGRPERRKPSDLQEDDALGQGFGCGLMLAGVIPLLVVASRWLYDTVTAAMR